MQRKNLSHLLLIVIFLSACAPGTEIPTITPVAYDPFVPLDGGAPVGVPPTAADGAPAALPAITEAPFIVPTAIPLSQLLPFAPMPGSPTPDAPHALPTARRDVEQYVVQPGDNLGSIAQAYEVSLEALLQANDLPNADVLEVGQTLVIPVPQPDMIGSSFKIIPDSELVYGPASALFNIEALVLEKNGFLAAYTEEVNDEVLSGAQIVSLVAQNYSVNPRLLLALIEHRSQWLSNPAPYQVDYALGIADATRLGLYRQLTFAANELNRGYYLWRADAVSAWVLADGSVAPADAGINAGTAGVQNLFSKLDDRLTWQNDVEAFGLFQTYFFLFGSPFDLGVEPVVPAWLQQPRMILPFERGVTWVFTGGPHGAWADGSAWAALDFAPIGETLGCYQSEEWVTALTDGLIIRTGDGQVIQDLDGDGYEQTGWVILYMHVELRDRVEPGSYIKGGGRIGHASCEGGASNGTHIHIARKYNGEWINADGALPFVLDGWTPSSAGTEYDGFLNRGAIRLEALEGITEVNTIQR